MPGEYGTYVATRDIRIGNALAFRKGDAVPVSHVQSGVVSLNDVTLAPSASPGPRDVFDERIAGELADPNSASSVALRAAFVPGRVLNNNGTVNPQKKLTVKLTADGLDIADLIIEDVA